MTIFSQVRSSAAIESLCLPELIHSRGEAQPNAIAIRTKSKQLTYGELNERANCFAMSLLEAGAQTETVVGVFMDRSEDSLAALLGVWKAGAAYLALDPSVPKERLAFMLRDCEAPIIVTDGVVAPNMPPHSARVLYAEDALSGWSSEAADFRPEVSPDGLAYVLYTSGSTGKPKGVEVCHGGLANVITAIAGDLHLRAGEVLLAHTSLGFDVSNLEMYLPLVSGGSVYIAERGRAGNGARLIRSLKESGATTMLGTPSLWRLLVDAGWEGKQDLRVISGGEILTPELAMALSRRSAEVWNHYGPTETTIVATTEHVDPFSGRVTIGWPISQTTLHVLDSDLKPVAPETIGELYIGGAGVSRGYRNRSDLTAASFFPDPFHPAPGARLYKTGDLACELADGRFEFHGRTDNQVKIHGYRIELEEIERQLCQVPQVIAAVVLALPSEQGDRHLSSWFEAKEHIPASTIREFLRKRLPAYMVPAEFRQVTSMPLNASGKVDRKSLEKDHVRPSTSFSALPEHDDMESRLLAIWEALLPIRPIGLDDRFFDLGGDSLLAALLVTQIEKQCGRKVTPEILIDCPTIRSLASRISTNDDGRAAKALVALREKGSKPPLFIVHGLGGSALLFRQLSASLGSDQPVYGVMLPSGAVHDRKEMEIEAVASKCLDEIRRLFPAGPYYISGHSFGALIAFEMAKQLTRSGETIGLLGLIDADRNLANLVQGQRSPVLRTYRAKLESLVEKGVAEVLRRRMEHIRLHRRVKLAESAAVTDGSTTSFEAKELMVLAAKRYKPVAYSGSAVLFRAKDEVRNESNRDLGWAELVRGELSIVDIPGRHLTIFDEPNVGALAACLNEQLSRVLSAA